MVLVFQNSISHAFCSMALKSLCSQGVCGVDAYLAHPSPSPDPVPTPGVTDDALAAVKDDGIVADKNALTHPVVLAAAADALLEL